MLYKLFDKVFSYLLVSIIAFQAILLIFSVVFRYLLNNPIIWADEIVRYSLIWMTFAGGALATKDNKHIAVDVIDSILPPMGKKVTGWFSDSVVSGFAVFLIYFGIKMTKFQIGSFGETLTWFSYVYVYVSIPIGAIAIIIFTISKYLNTNTS